MSESSKITARQIKAIELLGAGMQVKTVAKKVGVSPETVSRWRAQPEFQAHFDGILAASWEKASQRLATMASLALDVLLETLVDEKASRRDRLAAASRVLKIVDVKISRNPLYAEADELVDGFTPEERAVLEQAFAEFVQVN